MTPLTQWAAAMKFGGSAEKTVECRVRALSRLERLSGRPLLELTRADVVAHLAQYSHASTRSTNLSYVRCFFQWAHDEDLIVDNPCRKVGGVKVPRAVPRPAALHDVVAMLNSAKPRTRRFALLMTYAGLRCCEVALVRHDHFRRGGDGAWWLDIPHSKGGHHQSVPVPSWVAEEILAAPEWAVSTETVQRDTRAAFKAVGSPATPHMLRHFYATSALQTTQNLRKVQQMMRHASPATTARYTLVASSELSDAAEGLPRIA